MTDDARLQMFVKLLRELQAPNDDIAEKSISELTGSAARVACKHWKTIAGKINWEGDGPFPEPDLMRSKSLDTQLWRMAWTIVSDSIWRRITDSESAPIGHAITQETPAVDGCVWADFAYDKTDWRATAAKYAVVIEAIREWVAAAPKADMLKLAVSPHAKNVTASKPIVSKFQSEIVSFAALPVSLQQRESADESISEGTTQGTKTAVSGDNGDNFEGKPKRIFCDKCKRLKMNWFNKIRRENRDIPLQTFLKEFLANPALPAMWNSKRKGKTSPVTWESMAKKFRDNEPAWKPEYGALLAELEGTIGGH